jgi:hypothetical protein
MLAARGGCVSLRPMRFIVIGLLFLFLAGCGKTVREARLRPGAVGPPEQDNCPAQPDLQEHFII